MHVRYEYGLGAISDGFPEYQADISLDKPVFILHTPLGPMTIATVRSHKTAGYLSFDLHDEKRQQRFFLFSEEQLLSMPLEVTSPELSKEKAPTIGFVGTSFEAV